MLYFAISHEELDDNERSNQIVKSNFHSIHQTYIRILFSKIASKPRESTYYSILYDVDVRFDFPDDGDEQDEEAHSSVS